jgi:FMN phosphatase YigB (HAD superfamily)
MIGVAFALQETFGKGNAIERTAFERVVRQFSAQHGWDIDASVLERIASIDDTALAGPVALGKAFLAAFGSNLLGAGQLTRLEAMFRMAAAGAVGDCYRPYDDVAPALRKLADMHVPRVGLSGGWPTIDQRKADVSGFDGAIVFAQDLAVAASAPAAFARVADALKLPADRIWYVASDPRTEIVPAAASGLHTIWVNRDAAAFPAGARAPDATIESFAALFDVLSEPYTRGLLALRHILRTTLDWRPGHFLAADDDPPAGEPANAADAP